MPLEGKNRGLQNRGKDAQAGACRTDLEYLTTAETAQYLRYRSTAAVRQLVRRGKLKAAGPRGRTMLFRRSDIDAMITARAVTPVTEESGVTHAKNAVPRNHETTTQHLPHPGKSVRPSHRKKKGEGQNRTQHQLGRRRETASAMDGGHRKRRQGDANENNAESLRTLVDRIKNSKTGTQHR